MDVRTDRLSKAQSRARKPRFLQERLETVALHSQSLVDHLPPWLAVKFVRRVS